MQENSGRYDKKAGVMPEVIRYLKIEEKQVIKKSPASKAGQIPLQLQVSSWFELHYFFSRNRNFFSSLRVTACSGGPFSN